MSAIACEKDAAAQENRNQICELFVAAADCAFARGKLAEADRLELDMLIMLQQLDLLSHTAVSKQAAFTKRLEIVKLHASHSLCSPSATDQLLVLMWETLTLLVEAHGDGPVASCRWCSRHVSESEWGSIPLPWT